MVCDECQDKLRLHISPDSMRGRRRVGRSGMSSYWEGVNGVYGSELRVSLGFRPRLLQLLVIDGCGTLLLCDSRLRQELPGCRWRYDVRGLTGIVYPERS